MTVSTKRRNVSKSKTNKLSKFKSRSNTRKHVNKSRKMRGGLREHPNEGSFKRKRGEIKHEGGPQVRKMVAAFETKPVTAENPTIIKGPPSSIRPEMISKIKAFGTTRRQKVHILPNDLGTRFNLSRSRGNANLRERFPQNYVPLPSSGKSIPNNNSKRINVGNLWRSNIIFEPYVPKQESGEYVELLPYNNRSQLEATGQFAQSLRPNRQTGINTRLNPNTVTALEETRAKAQQNSNISNLEKALENHTQNTQEEIFTKALPQKTKEDLAYNKEMKKQEKQRIKEIIAFEKKRSNSKQPKQSMVSRFVNLFRSENLSKMSNQQLNERPLAKIYRNTKDLTQVEKAYEAYEAERKEKNKKRKEVKLRNPRFSNSTPDELKMTREEYEKMKKQKIINKANFESLRQGKLTGSRNQLIEEEANRAAALEKESSKAMESMKESTRIPTQEELKELQKLQDEQAQQSNKDRRGIRYIYTINNVYEKQEEAQKTAEAKLREEEEKQRRAEEEKQRRAEEEKQRRAELTQKERNEEDEDLRNNGIS